MAESLGALSVARLALLRLWAKLWGYFVLPCPVCGREFYGFQEFGGRLYSVDGRIFVTCKRCHGEHHG